MIRPARRRTVAKSECSEPLRLPAVLAATVQNAGRPGPGWSRLDRVIEEMTLNDAPVVARLLRQVYPDADDIDPTRARLAWKTLVARDERGVPVGFLLGTVHDYGLDGESYGTLVELVVDNPVRRQGIGRALVEAWKAWLLDEGMQAGFLLAAADAVPFYEECGFEQTSLPYMIWSPPAEARSCR